MKRSARTILFVIMIFCFSSASAQPYIGIFAGLNSSKLLGDVPDKASYKSLMGLNVGANLDLKLAKLVWLSLQPSYSQEGTKITYDVRGKEKPVDSLKIRLNYFSLPLLFKVTSTNERFYAIGGIEVGYLLDHYASSNDNQLDTDIKIEEWNLAAHFGFGYRIPLGLPRLFIELRYTQGLVNLTNEPIDESYIPRVKTNGFKILTGIEIPLKRTQN